MHNEVRRSVIAGTWYPGNSDLLRKTIEEYFANANERSVEGQIIGIISPHAGYSYSGQVAAYGYKQLIGKSIDVVTILSPFHQMPVGQYMANSASYYETPLGKVPVEKELLEQIAKEVGLTFVSQETEHSIEIQLPFLQVALKDFTLLPIMVGLGDVYGCQGIVEALLKVLKGKKSLLVASTDLHHIPDYDEVVKRDKAVVEALSSFDLNRIRKVLSPGDCSVCGKVPVSIVVDAAKRMGANKLIVLHQTNSGDVTGEKQPGQYTVGYLSAAIVKS